MMRWLLVWLAGWVGACGAEELAGRERGREYLGQIVGQEWAREWRGARLEEVRLVEPKADQAQPTGLGPVWVGRVVGAAGKGGYLMWEAGNDAGLVEFCFDGELAVQAAGAQVVAGVPALQQFPVDGEHGGKVASGCVPTAGASLVGYWMARGRWGKVAGLEEVTKRLRARMNMMVFPDTDGFTENRMPLAGCVPSELARALRADAAEARVEVDCRIMAFDFGTLMREIGAGRPALASCTVRVAHKPHLSWGHEVVAVGWARLGGVDFVGVVDNFFPAKQVAAVRWIRKDAFISLITVDCAAGKEGEPPTKHP